MGRYLVVVDMQNDFIDGALGTGEARAIVPRVKDKVVTFEGSVMFTRDTHGDDYLSTQEGKNLPVPHCIKGTLGWDLEKGLDRFAKENNCFIFDKNTFGSPHLAGYLSGIESRAHIDSVEIVGLCTDICVISNAMLLKAALPETEIIVDASCCAGVTPKSHRNALEAMKMCQITVTGE